MVEDSDKLRCWLAKHKGYTTFAYWCSAHSRSFLSPKDVNATQRNPRPRNQPPTDDLNAIIAPPIPLKRSKQCTGKRPRSIQEHAKHMGVSPAATKESEGKRPGNLFFSPLNPFFSPRPFFPTLHLSFSPSEPSCFTLYPTLSFSPSFLCLVCWLVG